MLLYFQKFRLIAIYGISTQSTEGYSIAIITYFNKIHYTIIFLIFLHKPQGGTGLHQRRLDAVET